ncbi:MAG: translation initiation factor IF-2, partial [Bacteroidales bacterium]|nr:translation initiation factor IF-2 [Bacteroidales bacterium]
EEKPAVEETPSPQGEEKAEAPVEEKPAEKKEAAPAEKEKSKVFGLHAEVAGPKILDTMDSETFRQAMAGKAVKAEEGTITKVNKIEDTPKPEDKAADAPAGKPRAAEEDNFIKTEYQKISGPTVVGVVDLSKVMNTGGGRNDRNGHRPVATTKSGSSAGGVKPPRKRIDNNKSSQNLSKPNLASHSDMGRPAKRNNGKKGQANKVVVVSDEEIKKKMQETMSRVHSSGNKTRSTRAQWIKDKQKEKERIEQEIEKENIEKRTLRVTEFVTVSELATMMNKPVTEIISTCMSLGLFVSINQRLSEEPISLLAEGFGFKVEFVDADVIHELESQDDEEVGEETPRTPIVTVMGHVDHGKTSLLDYIRKTNVIAGEAGGITQHIGAYEVQLEDGRKITFLDTPGHEAFTAMRARGAKMTDIAIIVVAADDRVMPQTVEAINHAQAAGVPIVFAINKVDKPAADPEKIKGELAEMNLLVEDWGGKIQSQDISAKTGLGVDALLEKVLLEAEMLELKAHPQKRGKGTIIESSLDKGRGYVAKILVQDGSIRVGDFVLAGYNYGRIKAMYNERNQAVKEAGPSQPVLLLGLNGAPQPGDVFNMMTDEKEAKEIANKRMQLQRELGLRTQKHITLDEIGRRIAIGDFKELNVIVKADVDGSVEALSDSLLKLSTPEVQVNVIHKSVGQITESDVLLASASEAIIIGFQVRPSVAARKLAESEQIDIRLYSVIYKAIEELKDAIEGMLSPEIQEKIVANLEIREVFKISKVGSVAGCMVLDGKLGRNSKIRIIRDGIVVYTGELGSLRRFKDDVKEVAVGQDCGLNIKNFNDIKVGDIIEGYEEVEVKRTL